MGIRLEMPTYEIIEQSFRLLFLVSNNEAGYEALITRFCLASGIGAQEVSTYYDSQLVVNQFNRDYKSKDSWMEAYPAVVKDLAQKFKIFELVRITRGENSVAYALEALASTFDPDLRRVIMVECISTQSIAVPDEAMVITRL